MTEVVLQRLEKYFGDIAVVQELDLTIKTGEFLVLLGPSGCGKSTTLRMIAGLESMTSGELFIGGKQMNNVDPKDRGVAMVFQNYALYPHKTVFENMQIALIAKNQAHLNFFKKSDGIYFTQAMELLQAVKLDNEANALSGRLAHGMQKQLELAIALASDPKLLLLDEPTAGMSLAETQLSIQLITNIVKDRSLTLLFTEHDMNVVFAIADHISVLHHGEVIVSGPPELIRQNQTVRRIYLGHDKV